MYVNTAYFQIILTLNYILAAENDAVLSMIVASTVLTAYTMYLVVDISKEYTLNQSAVAMGLFGCFLIHSRLIDIYNSTLTYRLMVFGAVLLFSFAGVVGIAEQDRQRRINSFMNSFGNLNNKVSDDKDVNDKDADDSDGDELTTQTQSQPTTQPECKTTCLMYRGDRPGYEAIIREFFKDKELQTLRDAENDLEPCVFETHEEYLKSRHAEPNAVPSNVQAEPNTVPSNVQTEPHAVPNTVPSNVQAEESDGCNLDPCACKTQSVPQVDTQPVPQAESQSVPQANTQPVPQVDTQAEPVCILDY